MDTFCAAAQRRLLPATEHTAWLGAHAPGALQPRASGTTGAAASSSLERLGHPAGLGAHKARPLAGRFPSEWAFSSGVCPKRAASGQLAAAPACSPRPSVAGNAAPWRKSGLELQFAGAQHGREEGS
jgi:hypothetical protein